MATARRRRRAVAVAVVALVVVVLLGFGAWRVWWSGDTPVEVAERYLRGSWKGDVGTACDLSTPQWRIVLFQGHPFADCAAYADATRAAQEEQSAAGFAAFRDDTTLTITLEDLGSDDRRARVGYLVEFTYNGPDRAGFEAVWQGAEPADRGTIELVHDEGTWLVAGVDEN